MSVEPIEPGGVVGILGGGQLGKMIAAAAARLGLRPQVFVASEDDPAAQVCGRFSVGSIEDQDAVSRFAAGCAVVTFETENTPLDAVDVAAARAIVRPGRRALETCQDRLLEKRFLRAMGLETTPFHRVDTVDDLPAALEAVGEDAILKTRRFGYDGKGQAAVRGATSGAARRAGIAAFRAVAQAPSILEARIPFVRELSVVGARGVDGKTALFDVVENRHEDGVLRRSAAPAAATADVRARACAAAERVMDALDHVGALAVEFFELEGGGLLVNEIAPRVHNTGHWTIEACVCDQFEQHVRAICGWPLGDPTRLCDATMINLLGEEVEVWPDLACEPGAALHLYGKQEARPGRKMGHVTRIAPRRARPDEEGGR